MHQSLELEAFSCRKPRSTFHLWYLSSWDIFVIFSFSIYSRDRIKSTWAPTTRFTNMRTFGRRRRPTNPAFGPFSHDSYTFSPVNVRSRFDGILFCFFPALVEFGGLLIFQRFTSAQFLTTLSTRVSILVFIHVKLIYLYVTSANYWSIILFKS